jgi:hypothetical protein
MTSAQVITKFAVLQDQYGSANFSDDETLGFLNMAQLEVLGRMMPDSLGGSVNFDLDSNVLMNVGNLIYTVQNSVMNSDGSFPFDDLNTLIRTISGDSTCEAFRILNIAIKSTSNSTSRIPIKYTRSNDITAVINNVFKAPSTSSFRYTIEGLVGPGLQKPGIRFFPANTGVFIDFTIMKTPRIMTAINSPEFNDYMMNQVILKALDLAAISTRDNELTGELRNSSIQSAQ